MPARTRPHVLAASALLCAVLAAIAFHPGRAAAQAQAQAMHTTEFDARITVTASGSSESLDGRGDVAARSEWDESFSTDMVLTVHRNKLDMYMENPIDTLRMLGYSATTQFAIASGSNAREQELGASRFPVTVSASRKTWGPSIDDGRLILTHTVEASGVLDDTAVGMHISPIPPGTPVGGGPVVSLVTRYRLVVSAGNLQSIIDPNAPRAKVKRYDQYAKEWVDEPQRFGISPPTFWSLSETAVNPEPSDGTYVNPAFFPSAGELESFLTSPKGSMTFDLTASEDRDTTWERSSETVKITLTLTPRGRKLEAVIKPQPGYEEWLPKGSVNEKTPGNNIVVTAVVQLEDEPLALVKDKVKYRYELIDTSRERGVCSNTPGIDMAAALSGSLPAPEYDVKISASRNPHLEVAEDGQSAVTREGQQDSAYSAVGWIWIDAYDYGARTRLKITAITEHGQEIPAHIEDKPGKYELAIPLDDNDNKVADAWEKQMGVFGKNWAANSDQSPLPAGQRSDGDGISLYDKYRGFLCSKLPDTGAIAHERLDPNYKHLFVRDANAILRTIATDPHPQAAALAFEALSGLRIRLVSGTMWTGAGSVGDGRRIVNFNSGDETRAVEQTALHITTTFDVTLVPADWLAWWEELTGQPLMVGPFDTWIHSSGMAFPDAGGEGSVGSPMRTYQINIALGLIDYHLKQSAAAHVRRQEWARQEADRIEQSFRDWVESHPYTYDDMHPREGESTEFRDAYEARYAQRDSEKEVLEQRIMQAVDDYIAAHPDEWQRRRSIQIAYVVAHELGHGVGMSHHQGDGGDKMCIMTVFECDYETDPYDVLDANQLQNIPNKICPSCMKQIVVSDTKG